MYEYLVLSATQMWSLFSAHSISVYKPLRLSVCLFLRLPAPSVFLSVYICLFECVFLYPSFFLSRALSFSIFSFFSSKPINMSSDKYSFPLREVHARICKPSTTVQINAKSQTIARSTLTARRQSDILLLGTEAFSQDCDADVYCYRFVAALEHKSSLFTSRVTNLSIAITRNTLRKWKFFSYSFDSNAFSIFTRGYGRGDAD